MQTALVYIFKALIYNILIIDFRIQFLLVKLRQRTELKFKGLKKRKAINFFDNKVCKHNII